MKHSLHMGVFILAGAMLAGAVRGQATWDGDGGAGSPEWSVGANWAGDTAPSTTAGGVITFNNTALGATNVVDDDWTVTTVRFDNNTLGLAHTTVVAAAKTLTIAGGSLMAGDSRSNSLAVIEGGTFQIGTASQAADVRVGVATTSGMRTNNRLRVVGDVNALNVTNIWVGRSTVIGSAVVVGEWDLSGATLRRGAEANVLKLSGDLVVGGGRGRGGVGTLRLPPSLREIACRIFETGYGQSSSGKGTAYLDFGAGSQLERITAKQEFHLGGNGLAYLTGWPNGVHLTVGEPGAPGLLTVGCGNEGDSAHGLLTLTNGSLTAWLTALRVGYSAAASSGNANTISGRVEAASAGLQIGDATNMVNVHEFRVGGGGGRWPIGVVRLPPALTNMTVGIFDIGSGSLTASAPGNGTLDFGAGPQLADLVVTQAWWLGNAGYAYLVNVPVGVNLTLGSTGMPIPMVMGQSAGGGANAELALSGGSFRAWLTELKVGCNKNASAGPSGGIIGSLDLSGTTVQIGDTPNTVTVPVMQLGAEKGRNGNGTLRLPAAVTNFSVGTLEIGAGAGTQFGTGLFDFGPASQLQTFAVTNELTLSWHGRGSISNLPAGVRMRIGTPDYAVPVTIGVSSNTGAAHLFTRLAIPENGRFEGHLASLLIAEDRHENYFSASQTAILDLTNGLLDALVVTGDVRIGHSALYDNVNARGTLALPVGQATIGGALFLGDEHSGSRGALYLEGTWVTVSNRVVVGPTGTVTNRLSGLAGGLDLRNADTNDLDIAAGGTIRLIFAADPAGSAVYWGLKMRGDATAHFQSLTTSPARVTFDLSGLSAKNQAAFGVYYDAGRDETFLGVPGAPGGCVIVIR